MIPELSSVDVIILALSALFLGLFLLVKGGDQTVESAVKIARKHGLSPILVGFTILAFGTSLAEMVVSVSANLNDAEGIAFGNIIGSNISNILFVLATTAVFCPLLAKGVTMKADIAMMFVAAFILIGLLFLPVITWWHGLLMLGFLIGYVCWQYLTVRNSPEALDHITDGDVIADEAPKKTWIALLIGLVFLAVGGELLVRGSVIIATMAGIPEYIIGLTMVAIGTSLPELATCLAAAFKKQVDMILGNIIGSNIFNVLSIIGVMVLVEPVATSSIDSAQLLSMDVWVMLAASTVLAALIFIKKGVPRWGGIIMLCCYAAYIAMIAVMNL